MAATKVCSKCGESKPLSEFHKHSRMKSGLRPSCKACTIRQNKAWQQANPIRYRDGIEQWWRDHPEKKAAKELRRKESGYFQRYHRENKAKIAAKSHDHYELNKPLRRRQVSEWRVNNKERVEEWVRAYRTPERRCVENHARRVARFTSIGSHRLNELLCLLSDQSYLCANPHCLVDLRSVKKHLDHKTPLSRGGSNAVSNLQWLCAPCNLAKATLNMEDWLWQLSI